MGRFVSPKETTSSDISVAPVGNISATTIQAAIAELDNEKASKTELADLDAAKANKGANTFTGAQTGGDNKLIQWLLQDVGTVYVDKGTVSTGTVTFDYSQGAHQRLQVGGAITVAVNGWAPTDNNSTLLIELVNGASAAITWPTINWVKSDGTTTTSFSSNGITLQTSGTDFIVLWTRDAGTTVYGKVVR